MFVISQGSYKGALQMILDPGDAWSTKYLRAVQLGESRVVATAPGVVAPGKGSTSFVERGCHCPTRSQVPLSLACTVWRLCEVINERARK